MKTGEDLGKVKVLKCMWGEWIGREVDVYWRYANGVEFVDQKLGRIFLKKGDYVEVI